MKKIVCFTLALSLWCSIAHAEISFVTKYFMAAARRLGNDFMVEGTYEYKHLTVSAGFARLEATDENLTRYEEINFIPLGVGGIYRWEWFGVKGGVNYNIFQLQNVDIDSEFGAYVAIELGKNPFLEIMHRFGDIKIETNLMEDGTNVMGWSIGLGYRW